MNNWSRRDKSLRYYVNYDRSDDDNDDDDIYKRMSSSGIRCVSRKELIYDNDAHDDFLNNDLMLIIMIIII
jgi:hypothetical protein